MYIGGSSQTKTLLVNFRLQRSYNQYYGGVSRHSAILYKLSPHVNEHQRHFSSPPHNRSLRILYRVAVKPRNWIFGGVCSSVYYIESRFQQLKESQQKKLEWYFAGKGLLRKEFEKSKENNKERWERFKGVYAKKSFLPTTALLFSFMPRPVSADTQGPADKGSSVVPPPPPDDDDEEEGIRKERTPELSELEQQLRNKLDFLQEKMAQAEKSYQRLIKKVEKENQHLRKQILAMDDKGNCRRKVKKSLIDMYSEVLDELSDYDSKYSTQAQLPRVVVVGDQSAGKTSVLEMIAQARIFPRGSGEMMTRSPVMVTLSEGPDHVARFRDSGREFDLTKEEELAALRYEIELRMRASCDKNKTVSNDTISLYVKGPGIARMVLVDLPGMINTETYGMEPGTKGVIRKISEQYMGNPNAIILCVQDGSVDAERSLVTDLVRNVDPTGKRTMFVLTKADLAEKHISISRIQEMLNGKLFPMKALGYFAVVAGYCSDVGESTISNIKEYEQNFFAKSKFFRSGVLQADQLSTTNLSMAVSNCFWKMVRDSVEQQAEVFKAARFDLETEWKNNFPQMRELGRDELFEKARNEILDDILRLLSMSPQTWDKTLQSRLWDGLSEYVIQQIYLPSAHAGDIKSFNTTADIKLRHWSRNLLPNTSIEIAKQTLLQEFSYILAGDLNTNTARQKAGFDDFSELKKAVCQETVARHSWNEGFVETLRVIQLNALEDRSVADKFQWESAFAFMKQNLGDVMKDTEAEIQRVCGPGWYTRWTEWSNRTTEQHHFIAIKQQLETLFSLDKLHPIELTSDELTTIRKNLEAGGYNTEDSDIEFMWSLIHQRWFVQKARQKCLSCRKEFSRYIDSTSTMNLPTGSEVDCSEVILFWRIQRMLSITSNTLRQQVMNSEAQRLENEVKNVLEEFAQNPQIKARLLTGRKVLLAEELKKVRKIQNKLEDFIRALRRER